MAAYSRNSIGENHVDNVWVGCVKGGDSLWTTAELNMLRVWEESAVAKQIIHTDKLYREFGPYSHAVRVGDMIFLHGAVGFDPLGNLPGSTPGRSTRLRAHCCW